MGEQWFTYGYKTSSYPSWQYAEELQRALREYRETVAKQQARDQEEMDADDRYDQEEGPATPAGD